jgi:hypothetical protein
MHKLLLPPGRRIMGQTMRLPPVQEPNAVIARNLLETLMDSDALRRIKRSMQSNKASGPLATMQRFTRPDGGINQAPSMDAGAHKMNARRVVNKTPGKTAGT